MTSKQDSIAIHTMQRTIAGFPEKLASARRQAAEQMRERAAKALRDRAQEHFKMSAIDHDDAVTWCDKANECNEAADAIRNLPLEEK